MKQKRQVGVLLILILIAAVVWLLNFRSKQVTADVVPSMQDDKSIIDLENPQIRMDQIERARRAEYKSSGRNPFSPAPPPSKPAPHPDFNKEIPGPQLPAPPPLPPPLALPANVRFYGFGTVPNGTSRRAFLTDGQEVYVVAEGETFLNRFRILRIGNASLEFEEIATGRAGSTPMIEEPAGGPSQ